MYCVYLTIYRGNKNKMPPFYIGSSSVERQMGTNSLISGSDSGKWRLDRANNYDFCADHFAVMESNKINLEGQIKNLQNEIIKLKEKK